MSCPCILLGQLSPNGHFPVIFFYLSRWDSHFFGMDIKGLGLGFEGLGLGFEGLGLGFEGLGLGFRVRVRVRLRD